MKIVTVANAKGGSGKSTAVTLLAVQAVSDGARVAMVDLNVDQGNLTQWWGRRGEPSNPALLNDYTNLVKDVRLLAQQNAYDYLFFDTPPLVDDTDVVEAAVALADVVIIPAKVGIFDLDSIYPLLDMCQARHKPFSFVLSDVDEKFKGLNAEMLGELTKLGPVCAARVSHRMAYINALTKGKTGPEIDAALRPTAEALWAETKRLMTKPAQTGVANAAH